MSLAFTESELRHGAPVLISLKKDNTGVTMLEFYKKEMPIELWEQRQDAIADALNVHLVEPIKYGGKNENDRNGIVLYTAPGAKPANRGDICDDEF